MSIEKIGTRSFQLAGIAACVLAAGTAPSAKAATNLILNPSFEAGVAGSPNASAGDTTTSGTTPWIGYNNYTAPYGGFYTAAVAHTGTQAGKTYSGPNCGIYQFVSATAGDSYTASAFINNLGSDALTAGTAQTEDLRLIFQDASNAPIGDAIVSPTNVNGTTAQNVWNQLSVTATAPAGTARVQVFAFMNNPNYGGGALYVDDVSLVDNTTAAPEPASLSAIGVAGVTLLSRRRRA